MLMKIHVEFNSIAEMVSFSKFAGNDLVQVPPSKKEQEQLAWYKDAYERTEANLNRAFERLRNLYDNPKIKAIIDDAEIAKNAKRYDQREKEKAEAIENNLELGARALNCLKAENIFTLKDLLRKTENELMKIPNMGKLTLKQIKDALVSKKLKLKRPPKGN
jgi:DNA-directed RNA polymerase alpha subunit